MLALMPLGWIAGALSLVGCLYMVAATALTARFLAGHTTTAPAPTPVSLIKPLHGAFPGMGKVLEGYCNQDYGAPVQIVFGVRDPADPAVAVVEALRARRPDADIELVIDPAQHGANRKVSNLINIAARARHPILVLSDADIGVGPDYLRQVTSALAGRGVGAVSCLYVGQDDGSPWSRLGAMAINHGFLPNAVLGLTLGLARPCFGSTIALRANTLAEIGGLHAFADHLADDYEIGRAVRARGLAIAVPRMVVSHHCVEASGADLIDHELRWGRTVLQLEPAGYLGSLITYPLPLAIAAGVLLGATAPTLALILTALGVRIACKFAMDVATGVPVGRWWLIPARDVLSFGVFVASFTVNTVGWQGGRFRVGRDGVLSHP
jgi:ceramide glucosyltransferase